METYRSHPSTIHVPSRAVGAAEVVLFIVALVGFGRGLGELALAGGCGAEGTLALLVAILATREILGARR